MVDVESECPGLGPEEKEWKNLDDEACTRFVGVCACLDVYGPAAELREHASNAAVEGCEGVPKHSDTWCTLDCPSDLLERGGVRLLLLGGHLGDLSASASTHSTFIGGTLGISLEALKSVFSAFAFSLSGSSLICWIFSSQSSRFLLSSASW